MSKQAIAEEHHVHDEWYKARPSLEELPEFLRHLTEDYAHDYGTICHAVAAAALAAARAVDASPAGGITGFQAGAVMWEFISRWDEMNEGQPMRLVRYEDLLYPQYAHKFDKTITPETWEWAQEEAREMLGRSDDTRQLAASSVVAHWQSIADGKLPFGLKVRED